MLFKRKGSAFFRGFCSAIELLPSESRRAHRNAILEAHSAGIRDLWAQVGEMVKGAEHEVSGKSAEKSDSKQRQAQSETRPNPYLW